MNAWLFSGRNCTIGLAKASANVPQGSVPGVPLSWPPPGRPLDDATVALWRHGLGAFRATVRTSTGYEQDAEGISPCAWHRALCPVSVRIFGHQLTWPEAASTLKTTSVQICSPDRSLKSDDTEYMTLTKRLMQPSHNAREIIRKLLCAKLIFLMAERV